MLSRAEASMDQLLDVLVEAARAAAAYRRQRPARPGRQTKRPMSASTATGQGQAVQEVRYA